MEVYIDGKFYPKAEAKISVFDILGLPGWVPRPARLIAGGQMRAMKAMADAAMIAVRGGEKRLRLAYSIRRAVTWLGPMRLPASVAIAVA